MSTKLKWARMDDFVPTKAGKSKPPDEQKAIYGQYAKTKTVQDCLILDRELGQASETGLGKYIKKGLVKYSSRGVLEGKPPPRATRAKSSKHVSETLRDQGQKRKRGRPEIVPQFDAELAKKLAKKYVVVSFLKNRFRANIRKGSQHTKRETVYLGCFSDAVEAAKAFDASARQLGRLSSLNFPTADEKAEIAKKGKVHFWKKPAAKKPTAKKPAAKKPTAKKPAAKKPAAKKPAAKKPAKK